MKNPGTLNPFKSKREHTPHQRRKHLNKKFYQSYTWRKFRKGYIQQLITKQQEEIQTLDLPDEYKLTLLDKLPVCEMCFDKYIKRFQPGVNEGKELDHIKPVNPENALETLGIYGQPLAYDNVQLLCARDHSEKSGADKAFHNNLKQNR